MMVPAAVMVLLILGAIAVDSAVVLLAKRELSARVEGVANDIAGSAVDEERAYAGEVVLDQGRADAYVSLAFDGTPAPAGFDSVTAGATVEDDRTVVVRAEGRVRFVFAPAIPGVRASTVVTAEARALATG